jgi:uncharacterized protein (TIGR02145 family)
MKHFYLFLMILFIFGFTNKLYCQSVPSYVPTNGLVGWWGFNGNAQDGSGNGNHGTVNGATLTTDRFGNQNGAYSFDGQSSIQTLNSGPLGTGITLSYWYKTHLNNYMSLVSYGSLNWGQYFDANLNHWAAQHIGPCFGPSFHNRGTIINKNSFNIDSTIWSHVVIVIPNNISDLQSVDFYLNGNLLYTTCSFINYGAPSPNISNGNPIKIGNNWFNDGAYIGKLDDIGIWNRALTQQEITNLYNSQLPTQTSLCLPSITTNAPNSIGIDSVIVGGNITNDGGSSIVLRGVCYSTTPNPNMGNMRTEDGSGVGSFSTILRNLNPSTTYYVRSYAKNSNGVVVYGDEVSFGTGTLIPGIRCPGTPSVTDIDGNLYHTVQIGTQCWTQSNLKVSRYRNGDSIPTGLSNSAWENTTAGAYAIYDNNPVNDGLYGKLYNLYAAMDTRGLCPTGWHVPTDGGWTTLETFLGGSSVAGVALKSTATLPTPGGWNNPSYVATNSSGFTALPGGRFAPNQPFFSLVGNGTVWWSSSLFSNYAWGRVLNQTTHIYRNYFFPPWGLSVRCLRD